MLKKHGHEIELLVHKAEPIEDHRFDGAASGDNAGLWRVLHRPVEDVADTKFVKHPGYETELIQDLTPGSSVHRRLLSMRRFYRHACAENGGKSPTDLSAFLPWQMAPERREELARPVPVTLPPFAGLCQERRNRKRPTPPKA